MGKRLSWIAMTYLTNNAFLVAVAIALGGAGLGLSARAQVGRGFRSIYPGPQHGKLRIDSLNSLDGIRRSGQQAKVVSIDLLSLWSSMEQSHRDPREIQHTLDPPPESFYAILDEFPNVRNVTAWFGEAHTGIAKVAALRKLEYLGIWHLASNDVTPFKSLDSLRRLDVSASEPVRGFDSLAALPMLETIVVRDRSAVDDDTLDAISQLPNLKTLALAFSGTPDPTRPLTEAGIVALGNSKSLESLYVDGYKMRPEWDLRRRAEVLLTRLSIKPAVDTEHPPLLAYMMSGMIVTMAVGWVLAGQFRSATSRLAGGFLATHLLVAASWLLAAFVPTAAILIADGYPLVSAASLCLVAMAIVLALSQVRIQNRRGRAGNWPQKLRNGWLAMSGWGLALLCFLLPADLALRDMNTLLLLGMLGAAGVSLTLVANTLHDLPLTAVVEDHPGRETNSNRQLERGWLSAMNERELQIGSWPCEPRYWTGWQRVQRWRAGNPPFRTLSFALLMCAGAISVPLILTRVISEADAMFGPTQLRSQLLLIPIMAIWVATFRVAQAWRNRLLSLGQESLHPSDRATLQREWAIAFASDLIPTAFAIGLIVAIGMNLDIMEADTWDSHHWSSVQWAKVPLDFLIVGTVGLSASLGIGAALVVIERNWVRVCLVLVVAAASLVAAGGLALFFVAAEPPRFLVAQLWAPLLLTMATSVSMWQQWKRIEFGRRG